MRRIDIIGIILLAIASMIIGVVFSEPIKKLVLFKRDVTPVVNLPVITGNVYDRVMKNRVIRCAYIPYPPSLIEDPNTGKVSGIMYTAVNAVANNLGVKAEFIGKTTWANMVGDIENDRYDLIVSGVWPESLRATKVDFSTPLFYSGIYLYARENDNRFRRYDKGQINNERTTIAVVDGEMSSKLAKAYYPKAKTLLIPSDSSDAFSDMQLRVLEGHADIAIVEAYQSYVFTQNQLNAKPKALKLKNLAPTRPVKIYGNTFMLKRGQTEFKSMLNTAIEEWLNSGSIDNLLDATKEYEPKQGLFLRHAYPYRPRI